MQNLHTIFSKTNQDERLDDDGLIHCTICGEARQIRLAFGDWSQTVRCLCSCQNALLHDMRERQYRQEELDRFARIRSAAIEDPILRKCTFASSEFDSLGIQIAQNYVHQWDQMQEKGMGLLFWGPTGTGKTYIAACIANALIDQDIPVLMTSLGRMLGTMPGPASGEQTAIIDQWMQYPLLIIDDLGVERDSPYTTELVYHIIDSRYRSGKPMVITTNLTMKEMENPKNNDKNRIYDRVLERCTPVNVDGCHIRDYKKKGNRAFARTLLP